MSVLTGHDDAYVRQEMLHDRQTETKAGCELHGFEGAFPLGSLTQLSAAFGEVHEATDYLVRVFPEIAEWKAVVDRLIGFQRSLGGVGGEKRGRLEHRTEGFEVTNLPLWLPGGKTLLDGFDLRLQPGKDLLIRAPSRFQRKHARRLSCRRC